MQIPLQKVPIDVRRRVAQHLESLRGAELGEAAGLHLGDSVVPIYRPDLDQVAYYEFSLQRGASRGQNLATCGYAAAVKKARKEDAATQASAHPTAGGFIIASAARHDFPLAHWSLDRRPPSALVLDSPDDCGCGVKDTDGKPTVTPARLFKLDTLAYVAEADSGEIIGASGQVPTLIAGLPHSLEKYAGRISSSSANPTGRRDNDMTLEPGEHAYERTDADVPDIELQADDVGWGEYKKRYADAFGPLLDALRQRAARTWALEDAIAEYGEGILTGTRHRVALLGDAGIRVHGEAADLVRATLEEGGSGPPALVIDALPGSLQREIDFTVSIKYANGEHETLKFFLVSRDTPTNGRDDKSDHCQCED